MNEEHKLKQELADVTAKLWVMSYPFSALDSAELDNLIVKLSIIKNKIDNLKEE